jgi:DNA replication protein DnaC
MSDIYDPLISRLDSIYDELAEVSKSQSKTNELLERILNLLENPPTQKIVHTNINFDAAGHTSGSLESLVKRLKEA